MFWILNKNKVISILVICVCAFGIISLIPMENSVQVSSNSEKLLPIYSVDCEDKKVALTLNCAWSNEDIDQILDTLKEYNVNVTFFIVGDFAKKYPDSIKKIYDAGHELGNHSNTHPHVNNLSIEQNMNEIKECNSILSDITGITPKLYRSPYGEYNNNVITACNNMGMKAIQWNIDTLDYTNLNNNEMWNRIENRLEPGSIVLMHTGTQNTANALPYILEHLFSMKYEIVKVSDMVYTDNAYINSQGIQKQK